MNEITKMKKLLKAILKLKQQGIEPKQISMTPEFFFRFAQEHFEIITYIGKKQKNKMPNTFDGILIVIKSDLNCDFIVES